MSSTNAVAFLTSHSPKEQAALLTLPTAKAGGFSVR